MPYINVTKKILSQNGSQFNTEFSIINIKIFFISMHIKVKGR